MRAVLGTKAGEAQKQRVNGDHSGTSRVPAEAEVGGRGGKTKPERPEMGGWAPGPSPPSPETPPRAGSGEKPVSDLDGGARASRGRGTRSAGPAGTGLDPRTVRWRGCRRAPRVGDGRGVVRRFQSPRKRPFILAGRQKQRLLGVQRSGFHPRLRRRANQRMLHRRLSVRLPPGTLLAAPRNYTQNYTQKAPTDTWSNPSPHSSPPPYKTPNTGRRLWWGGRGF